MIFPDLVKPCGAEFSPCQQYRYSLWRVWDPRKALIGGLLLNPSTATADTDDHTVYRMSERARYLGFGGLIICNIFAWRSTDPEQLYKVEDPVGPENDEVIMRQTKRVQLWLCGWGKHGHFLGRGYNVYRMLYNSGFDKMCALKVNKDDSPAHPLYLPYSLKPTRYIPSFAAASARQE